jgi:hypothetical protein
MAFFPKIVAATLKSSLFSPFYQSQFLGPEILSNRFTIPSASRFGESSDKEV